MCGLNVDHYWNFQKVWNENSQAILRSDDLINKILLFCLQYNTIQLFYCFISFHMRHSQNTFINMFNINTKNDISFSIMLNKRSIWKKENIYSPMQNGLYMLNAEILKYWGCVPLSQHTARLIWTALSVPKGYCLDIANMVSCFSFNTNAKRALNLG